MANAHSAARYLAVRKKLGLSQPELAKALKVRKQTVSSWERGVSDPRIETARELARLAGVHVEWLLSGEGPNGTTGSNVVNYIGRGRRVPKLGDITTRIPAVSKRQPTDFVQTQFDCGPRSYALQIVGDSMEEDFRAGDVVVIDPDIEPMPGDFVHVEMTDGRVLFRKYRPQVVAKGVAPAFDLVPSNEDWPTVRVDGENPGKIKGVMSERTMRRRQQH